MKERGPNTLAVHAGEVPDPVTGASAPNLVMSSTFALDEPAGFSINAFEGERPYIYTRWGNPTVKMLEEKLAALEGAEDCVAFGSGMAATAAVLLAVLKAGDHLVMSDVNYAGKPRSWRAARCPTTGSKPLRWTPVIWPRWKRRCGPRPACSGSRRRPTPSCA